jgi:hypothetical protein
MVKEVLFFDDESSCPVLFSLHHVDDFPILVVNYIDGCEGHLDKSKTNNTIFCWLYAFLQHIFQSTRHIDKVVSSLLLIYGPLS